MAKIQVDGKEVSAYDIGFQAVAGEPIVEYMLEDRSIIRLKVVLMRVLKAETELATDGTPIYQCKYEVVNIMHTKDG